MRAPIVASLALCACTPRPYYLEALAPPANAAPPDGDALAEVCVARPDRLGTPRTTMLRDNGALVGALRRGTYFCYLASWGAHAIRADASDVEIATIDVYPGRRYVLRFEASLDRDELSMVDPDDAETMLAACSRLDLQDLADEPDAPDDGPSPTVLVPSSE